MVVDSATSIRNAIEQMRDAGQDVLPITENDRLVGVLTQAGILRFVGDDGSGTDSVSQYMDEVPSVPAHASGSEVIRLLEKHGFLIVTDDLLLPTGLLTPASYVGTIPEPVRPHMVGGMATPFGVYLTTGILKGGKGGWNLVFTGAFMGGVFGAGYFIAALLAGEHPSTVWLQYLPNYLPFILMILMFRLNSIAGYHAAEHQVVHAIERGEPIVPEVVARMPRVHPRCGTNIAVGLTMFTLIAGEDPKAYAVRLPLAVFVTLFSWRSVGSFVQYWITTRPATPKQIQSAIDAANELIQKYQVATRRTPTFWTRIWSSGLMHVMAGSLLASGIWLLVGQFLDP